MARFNFQKKCVECRVVYYGPGFCGKTTNIQVIHEKAPQGATGDLSSIATKDDRTLFFDFMPMDLGKVAGLDLKFLMYTVPGQVYYNNTRKLVLQAVDGIIFVADSDKAGNGKMAENIQSMENLRENLLEQGRNLEDIPIVLQYNKRDLPETYTVAELNEKLNPANWPTIEAVAFAGEGIFQTIKALARIIVEKLNTTNATQISRVATSQGIRSITPGSDVEINLESITPNPPPPPPQAAPTKIVVSQVGTVNLQNAAHPPLPATQPMPALTRIGDELVSPPSTAGQELISALQTLVAGGGGGGTQNLLQQMGSYKPDQILKAIQNLSAKKGSSLTIEKLFMKPEDFDWMMKNFGEVGTAKGFSQSKFTTDSDSDKKK